MKMKNDALRGTLYGLTAGLCWSLSGIFGQFLFTKHIVNEWLVPVRLLMAGITLLIYLMIKNREECFQLIKHKKHLIRVVIMGIVGTMMFQFSYFKTISLSNAGTATVLQFMSPAMILIYHCLHEKRFFNGKEGLSVILAFMGIILISTHGSLDSLALSPETLFWGLLCALFMTLNSLIPESLYKTYSITVVMCFAFLSGGFCMNMIFKPWSQSYQFDIYMIIALFFVIIVGSVFGYLSYGKSISLCGSAKASLYSSVELVASELLSVICFKVSINFMDMIGILLIIGMVFLISMPTAKKEKGKEYEYYSSAN